MSKPPASPQRQPLHWGLFSKYRGQMFGITILGIMVFHYFELANDVISNSAVRLIGRGYTFLIGNIGVETFLFLSGMGLWFSMTKTPDVGTFYQKRFRRVLIPYLIWGAVFWVWKDLLIYQKSIVTLLLDYTTLSFWLDGNKNLWYVSFILVMYLLFPLIFRLLKGDAPYRGIRTAAGIVVVTALTVGIRALLPEVYDHIEIALYRIPVFLLGVYYAKAIAEDRPFSRIDWLLVAAGIAGKAALLVQEPLLHRTLLPSRFVNGYFVLTLMIIMVKLLPLLESTWAEKVLLYCGKLSFELYITHVSLRTILNAYGLKTTNPLYYLLCLAASFLLSEGLHRLVEFLLSRKKKA